VKQLALEREIEVVQPRKLRDGVLAKRLTDLAIDLGVVVAYGRILPVDVFRAPPFETWNVHASLLPRHRGASPIQHAILTGDAETGVTLMELTEGMDEGPMLLSKSVPLDDATTAGALTETLARLGGEALLEGLRIGRTEGLTVTPQPEAGVTYAPMIEKAAGRLDFAAEDAGALARRVRAFDPWPGTFVRDAKGQPLKITAAAPVEGRGAPGTILALDPLTVAAASGALRIDELQPAGKKRMPAAAFLNGAGRHLTVGVTFVSPPPSA
jgi:methionyl-tRNA formyltransferase